MQTVRRRLEAARRDAQGKLQQIRGAAESATRDAGGLEDVIEGDGAQANLLQHIEMTTYQRLAERVARLDAALDRLREGTYGLCERCGQAISPKRMAAIPEATACVPCQEALERMARRPVAA